MISWWAVLTAFGIGVMCLLVGILILFLVSAVYHFAAKREKPARDRPEQTPSDTLSKKAA